MNYSNLTSLGLLQTEYITSTQERVFIADDVFAILQEAYREVKGGLHFSSPDELVLKTSAWRVIYFHSTIVGVVIYKAKRGLKMVALALSSQIDSSIKRHTKSMLSYLFRITFRSTWMEVSENAERFILAIGGDKFLIPNSYAHNLTQKDIVELDSDGYHYYREINGILKRKIILGTVAT
jgi:hypothetical protein